MKLLLILFAVTSSSLVASTISERDSQVYAANGGWIDFRPSGSDGVIVTESYLAGRAYAANLGWIDLGNGSPKNGHTYSNDSRDDYGVNLSEDGELTGYAYGANIGWIVFEQQWGQPRLDYRTGQFGGLVYAQNLGWISLGSPVSTLVTATIARPDEDLDGIADAYERMHFGNLNAANAKTDSDQDGMSDQDESLAGTDPRDPRSLFRIIDQEFDAELSSVSLEFSSTPSRLYRLEHTANLGRDGWMDSSLGTFAPDPGASTTRTVSFPPGRQHFFRAVAIRPLEP